MSIDKVNYYTFKIKCRGCGREMLMAFGPRKDFPRAAFERFIEPKIAAPMPKRCECDFESFLLHDLISYCL